MLAALAPVLNLLANPIKVEAARAETNRLANVGGANTDEELQTLQTRLNNVGRGRSANKQRDRIRAQIEARKEELAIIGKGLERQQTINLVEDSRLKKIRQQNDLLKAKINGNYESIASNVLGNYGRIFAEYVHLKNFKNLKLQKDIF